MAKLQKFLDSKSTDNVRYSVGRYFCLESCFGCSHWRYYVTRYEHLSDGTFTERWISDAATLKQTKINLRNFFAA